MKNACHCEATGVERQGAERSAFEQRFHVAGHVIKTAAWLEGLAVDEEGGGAVDATAVAAVDVCADLGFESVVLDGGLERIHRQLQRLQQLHVKGRAQRALVLVQGIVRLPELAVLCGKLGGHGGRQCLGVRLGQRVADGGLQAYVGITVQPRSGKEVLRRLSTMAQVQQLCAVSGEFDYVAWLRTDSPEQLDQLLDQIGSVDGVEKTTTSIILSNKLDRGQPI